MAGGSKYRNDREEQSEGGSSHTSSTRTLHSIGGFDGPKETPPPPSAVSPTGFAIKNIEMGVSMWCGARGSALTPNLPPRPSQPNKLGREVSIGLNTFNVTEFPTKIVHQYDVTIVGNSSDKRMVILKVWRSKAVQSAVGQGWLFDGNKLAWSLRKFEQTEISINVDLNVEEGKRSNDKNKFRVSIRFTKDVKFDLLRAYLAGRINFSPEILEILSFLDHLMREFPSQNNTQIKKSFFSRGQQRFTLGNGVEAFKGVFASIRISTGLKGPCLSVNIDVANGTFFAAMDLRDLAREICRGRGEHDLNNMFKNAKKDWHKSPMYKYLKAFTHVTVVKKHMEKDNKYQEFKIHRFINKDPHEVSFKETSRDDQGNVISEKSVTIADYFSRKYGYMPQRDLPLVELTKKGEMVPLEMLRVPQNQRYKWKLDEKQTSQMIKFAVTLPAQRWEAVQHGLRMLSWGKDPYLSNYGLKISENRTEVKGRVLPTPEPTFLNGKIDARTAATGRWRIDGKKFLLPNKRPLKAWGVAIINPGSGGPCVDKQYADTFMTKFRTIYRTHGGNVESAPHVMPVGLMRGGEMITDIWNATGNKFQMKPQLLFFVVPNKNSDVYQRIKKSCECRYGVVSQVLQSSHVQKAQDQYISNVCMKVNAKLGGATCKAVSTILPRIDKGFANISTMILGADVSHAAPGNEAQGSVAAITCSLDSNFTRYAAACATNGSRVEIISTYNINTSLKRLAEGWMASNSGKIPQRIIYYRDGVSEGQYQHVITQEVADMKALFQAINPKAQPKFTVVICAKRHHIRFFPLQGSGDRNGNPLPGTLVEVGCTNPFEFDFYLAAHSAIKGTARPVHYHVIMDENNLGPTVLQQVTFEHCFQYARSTTPVSIHPAVYYAHLASNRSKAHENKPVVSSGKKESHMRAEKKKEETTSSSERMPTEIPPLMDLNNQMGIALEMWYI